MRKQRRDLPERQVRRLSPQTIVLAVAIAICVLAVGYAVLFRDRGAGGNAQAAPSRLELEDIPFNGTRAYEYLKKLCEIGRRPSGSPGMEKQRELLTKHFEDLGAKVELQKFRIRHPVDGSLVPMANLIVHWHPESKERVALFTHYDTLPYPLEDREDPRGLFVGANDGGSGVAVLMELGNEMPKLEPAFGVDFVMLDGEEFMFQPRGRFFLGSEWFARRYVQDRPDYRYRWGVLLDMVGDADLQIYQERYSLHWRDTRPLVMDLWGTAKRLGVVEFVSRPRHAVRDDHLMLHDIGGIPTCDVIDFDYPPWHTRGDTVDKCSALSLAKVGWVVREWLVAVRPDRRR